MVWQSRFDTDYANGYDEYGRLLGPQKREHADAAGSMQTTLADFARFMQAMMNGQGLHKKTRELMLSPQVQILSKHESPTLTPNPATTNQFVSAMGWVGACTGRHMEKPSLKKDTMTAGATTPSASRSRRPVCSS